MRFKPGDKVIRIGEISGAFNGYWNLQKGGSYTVLSYDEVDDFVTLEEFSDYPFVGRRFTIDELYDSPLRQALR